MKRYLLFVSSFFVLLFTIAQNHLFIPHIGIQENAVATHAFINGVIHLDSKTTINDGMLLIKGDRITDVGESIPIPKNAIIHDLNQKHIYPSFIELVSELNVLKEERKKRTNQPQYKSSKEGPYHWNEAVRPEYNTADFIQFDHEKTIPYLEKGYGIVLSHQNNGIVRGTGTLLALTKDYKKVILIDKAANFFSFSKGKSNQIYPTSLMGSIALLRQYFIDSKWYEKNNVNFHPTANLSYKAQIANNHLPNMFMVESKLNLFRAQKISKEANLDFYYKGTGKEYENLEQIKALNPKLIIPVDFPKPMNLDNPYDAISVSTSELSHWKYASTNLGRLEKENLSYCITSSTLKSKDFFNAIRSSIKNKASVEKIIYSLTELPARWLGIDSICGNLKKGKLANFIITDSKIFSKNSNVIENWVLGSKQFEKTTEEIDIRGTYQLICGTKQKKLTVSGTVNSPKAIISYPFLADSTVNGDLVFNNEGEKIKTKKEKKIKTTFFRNSNTVNLNYPEGNNYIRLNGLIEDGGNKWSGEGQNKNGDWLNWSVVKNKNLNKVSKDSNSTADPIKSFNSKQHLDFCQEKYPSQENIIFKNATIWTSDELGTFKGDLWIKNGKIIAVGKNINTELSDNLKIIDLDGKHISPGIIDEHSHIAIQNGVNEGSNAITSEVRIGDVINPEDINIYRQLSGGVTAAQLLHGSANPVGGQSAIIKMRWGQTAENMKIHTAPGFIKFALGENVKQSNWGWRYSVRYPQTRMGVEQIYYDAFSDAKNYQNSINNYNSLSNKEKNIKTSPKRNLQLEALSEIIDEKRFITCHSYIQSEINMLMKMADSMGFQINTFTHILEGYKVADKMKKHGVGASTFSDWWAYKYEVRDAIPYNACMLSKMGIVTAVNSDDAEMGRRLNQEASKAIKYGGCSENEALKLVTLNPAKLLHIDQLTGSIKVGKDADIVIWTRSPLSIYSKVEQTYVDGRLLFDSEKQEDLFKENEAKRSNLITEMIAAKKNGAPTQSIKKQVNKLHKCNDFEIDE